MPSTPCQKVELEVSLPLSPLLSTRPNDRVLSRRTHPRDAAAHRGRHAPSNSLSGFAVIASYLGNKYFAFRRIGSKSVRANDAAERPGR